MFTLISLVTSIKDYVEITHKLLESDNLWHNITSQTYFDFGAILTYLVLTFKKFFTDFVTFNWIQKIWGLHLIIPEITKSMISEISVLDGYFHNAFTFLETPISYDPQNNIFTLRYLEKFSIGVLNSLFLFFPTSIAHIISLRRFIMQGVEAGYISGLGTLAGNLIWMASILFGWRFLVIPWLSLDVLRYLLGFILLTKYMWDSYTERRMVLEDISKRKIFLLNFLLAFTEQTNIFPFLGNISFSSDSTVLENFPSETFFGFLSIHTCYLLGICIGGLSLLQFTCWFWENPAFRFYLWMISSFKITTGFYSKTLNFIFLYITMICTFSSLAYFGLDTTIMNPLGFINEERVLDQKTLLETAFLNTKASDRNTRRNRGRHGRRERWKRRVRKYRTFDASLYDDGIYDLFTLEDLNYGFDRFWLRRKMRNHRIRFRFFPGPWMRSFKKQLARPRLDSFMGPRVEYFRILFEQAYHPSFHSSKKNSLEEQNHQKFSLNSDNLFSNKKNIDFLLNKKTNLSNFYKTPSDIENSIVQKFLRKISDRIKIAKISGFESLNNSSYLKNQPIYKSKFLQLNNHTNFPTFSTSQKNNNNNLIITAQNKILNPRDGPIKEESRKKLSKKSRGILRYKTFLLQTDTDKEQKKENGRGANVSPYQNLSIPFTLLHPLKFFLHKEQNFQRKLKNYGPSIYRNFGVEKNSPYLKIFMKKFFYYYKPTLRWKRTMHSATLRKSRRKGPRIVRRLNVSKNTLLLSSLKNEKKLKSLSKNNLPSYLSFKENKEINKETQLNKFNKNELQKEKNFFLYLTLNKNKQKPTHFFSLVDKKATRLRFQISKDVLQHWYYTPFNRFFLKMDVDSFLKRQPFSHFLTTKEEFLLHLRRFLLFEHYETLRWYTFMQHYKTFKARVGGTKSFANRIYNQQFQGTFKKIRHLFSITPSFSNKFLNVLKFDQPLYNEYPNNKEFSILEDSLIHEEILILKKLINDYPKDLINQSTNIIREYLIQATPKRQKYIEQLLKEKNYKEITKFIFSGKKIRGTRPTTNQSSFFEQEKNYLLNENEKNELSKKLQENLLEISKQEKQYLTKKNIEFLKKSQSYLYDQESLKNYIIQLSDKKFRRNQKQKKHLIDRLQNIQTWFNEKPENEKILKFDKSISQLNSVNTSIQKAVVDVLMNSSKQTSINFQKKKLKIAKKVKFIAQNFQNSNTDRLNESMNSVILSKNWNKEGPPSKPLISQIFQKFSFLLNKFKSQFVFLQHPSLLFQKEGALETNKTKKTLKKYTTHPEYWRKKQRILTKRKQIRKTLKRLKQKKGINKNQEIFDSKNWKKIENQENSRKSQDQNELKNWDKEVPPSFLSENKINRKKKDSNLNNQIDESQKNKKKWKLLTQRISNSNEINESNFAKQKQQNFQVKRSRRKRSGKRKARSPIKKRTLNDSLLYKNQIKQFQKTKKTQNAFLDFSDEFKQLNPKQRRTRLRKHRYWKEHKKSKFANNKRKKRKRKRSLESFYRSFLKKTKRSKGYVIFQKWWWQNFIPNYQANLEAFLQVKKDEFLKKKFQNLSSENILKRSNILNVNFKDFDSILQMKNLSQRKKILEDLFQIGDTDFTPLALPQALKIRKELEQKTKQNSLNTESSSVFKQNTTLNNNLFEIPVDYEKNLEENKENQLNFLTSQILNSPNLNNKQISDLRKSKHMIGINPMPFYAGWDETLRKFIITNRFLSRQQTHLNLEEQYSEKRSTSQLRNFSDFPLQGMNAATTLYWQVPFTTYDPDQFFALGMDGFSPLGWKRFHFRHLKSSLNSKFLSTINPLLVKTKTVLNQDFKKSNSENINTFYKIHLKMFNLFRFSPKNKSTLEKKLNRRIKKRYKRVKKHPRAPVWFPSGPLLHEVLPVHYIYVFYKRSRLPRDRYIRRRLRRGFSYNTWTTFRQNAYQAKKNLGIQKLDFTLRRRVKPRRRYHRKTKPKISSNLPRRRPFRTLASLQKQNSNILKQNSKELKFFRPFPKRLINQLKISFKNDQNQEFPLNLFSSNLELSDLFPKKISGITAKKFRKKYSASSNNVRIRQLRRRIPRQVLRPIWRYRPRAGGFVWPGDYLRLELVKSPTLHLSNEFNKDSNKTFISQKKRKTRPTRNIQEWQIQPKKYLLQKQNIKILRKRLEKSYNIGKIHQKTQELKFLLTQK